MRADYILAVLIGIASCVVYYFRVSQKKLEDYVILLITSAGVIGGLKTALIALYGKNLKNVSHETRFFIFVGGMIVSLVSIYAGSQILNINLGLFS